MSVQKQGSINTAHCSDYWGQVHPKRESSLLSIALHVHVYVYTLHLPDFMHMTRSPKPSPCELQAMGKGWLQASTLLGAHLVC